MFCSINGEITHSVISDGVFVGDNSVIHDSVIMPGAYIGENVIIENTDIDDVRYVNKYDEYYIVLDDVLSTLDPEEKAVVSALTAAPRELDDLLESIELPSGKVLNILTRLSLRGIVKYHPGKRVSL